MQVLANDVLESVVVFPILYHIHIKNITCLLNALDTDWIEDIVKHVSISGPKGIYSSKSSITCYLNIQLYSWRKYGVAEELNRLI